MRRLKKVLSVLMIATTLFTTIPLEGVLAQNVSELSADTNQNSDVTDAGKENTEDVTSTETKEVSGTESTEKVEGTEEKESTEKVEGTEEKESTEKVEDTESTEKEESTENKKTEETQKNESTKPEESTEKPEGIKPEGSTETSGKPQKVDAATPGEETDTEEETLEYLIQYLLVNEKHITLNQKQQVVVGIGCEKAIEEAALQYHNQDTGESFQQYFTEVIDNAILFEMLFENESQSGAYQLDSVTFKVDGEEYTEDFATAGIEAVFGVNQEVTSNPDAVVDDGTNEDVENVDVDVVRIDENGDTISESSIEEALDNANAGQISAFSLDDEEAGISAYSEDRAGNVVVVLDPGHDNTHAGAQGNGLKEETLNLKIAAYCKEELEQYQGVTVYMVRALDGSCPYPGTTSGQCNEQRVAYAKSVGADIYVSIHNNSASASAQGAEVYYPNSNYNPWVGATGQGLAQVIENHLVALGLYNRGIKIRDAQEDKYPDGSAADYYGVIRNSKLAGIPAIIIEHAFVTNSGDANNFLGSDEKLKMLGVADATAIAEYYGLSKEINITVTSGKVQISNVNNSAGTALMSVSNVAPGDKIRKVSYAVWSTADQSDLAWYDVANNGNAAYQATLDISKHKYNIGTYYIDAYAYDIYGGSHYLGGGTCAFSESKVKITAAGNAAQTTYTITASNVVIPGGINSLRFAVWSEVNDQDDLIWYTATKNAAGNYVANVPISNHRSIGTYYVHAYIDKKNGTSVYAGQTSFKVSDITSGSVSIENVNNEKGQFNVRIKGMTSVSGFQQIQVAVWSKSDQSNLYTYIAKAQPDGSYLAQVDIANHKYAYESYYVDAYGIAGNGVQKYLGGKTVKLTIPAADVSASGDARETNYAINITNLKMSGTPQNVRVAVWSKTGGMDDLKWYDASATALSGWRANVSIANHKTAGLYYADVYVIDASGVSAYVGGTTFNVSGLSMQKIQITNRKEGTGQFDIVLTGLSSKSGISSVQIPVWSQSNQSDLHWYNAELQSNGTYRARVDLANHNYNYGTYYVDVYGIAGNGIQQYLGGTKVPMNKPAPIISAVGDATESNYTVTISNAGLTGGIKSMSFAVWSKTGGQDDIKWYTGAKKNAGTWTINVPISSHKTAGLYYVDVYATNASNNNVYMGGTTFQVSAPTASAVNITNKNEGTGRFDVVISGVSAKSGISAVQVPVWCASDQSDLHWYTAVRQTDGSYVASVSIANHQYHYGTYHADAYVIAGNGVSRCVGGKSVKMNVPKAQITASGNATQTKYSLTASSVGIAGGVESVRFAVWSLENGQDDLIWYNAANTVPGTWSVDMAVANHKTAGTYCVDAYAQSKAGSSVYLGGTTFKVDGPTVSSIQLINYNEADGTFGVQANGVKSSAGIASVRVAVWSLSNQGDLVWYNATLSANGSYQIGADIRNHQSNTGTYYADVYITDNNNISIFGGGISCSMINITNVLHPLMGSTTVTVRQMAEYYKASAVYPAFYASTEAPTIEAFCKIYMEEAQAEGVKAEVAFCQAMKETGYLKFGGNVSITQFNFAGLGSTGPGVAGESYPDVRTGIRAQIQHLKAYGCSEPLNQACVDTRFQYVTRNTAPYVEWLGIQENPYGKGWATAKNYGYDIVRMVNNLKTY